MRNDWKMEDGRARAAGVAAGQGGTSRARQPGAEGRVGGRGVSAREVGREGGVAPAAGIDAQPLGAADGGGTRTGSGAGSAAAAAVCGVHAVRAGGGARPAVDHPGGDGRAAGAQRPRAGATAAGTVAGDLPDGRLRSASPVGVPADGWGAMGQRGSCAADGGPWRGASPRRGWRSDAEPVCGTVVSHGLGGHWPALTPPPRPTHGLGTKLVILRARSAVATMGGGEAEDTL